MTGPISPTTLSFVPPQPPPSFSIKDMVGEVLIVIIGGHHPQVPTESYGIKSALSLTVIPLTGRNGGVPIEDVVLFGKASECFPGAAPGTASLVTVVKSGRAYLFDPAIGQYAEQLAQHWLASVGDVQTLVANAIRNHAEQARQFAEQLRGGAGTPAGVTPSPQYVPPGATVTPAAAPPAYAPPPAAAPPAYAPSPPPAETPPQPAAPLTFGQPATPAQTGY